jgi:DNA-binding IclR family transcriptional regulator
MTGKPTNTLQTLDRGLTAIEIIARRATGVTIADLAIELGVHRAIAYRIVSTLEEHALVSRMRNGQIYLGSGVLVLASRFEPQLRELAEPLLRELARETSATAFLSAAHGTDAVAILVAEPDEVLLRVGYRVGSRHPLARGAAGIAILAGRPEAPGDSDAVRQARRDGYSITRGQLQRGAVGVASPICSPGDRAGSPEASVGVVAMDDLNTEVAIPAVQACAGRIRELLRG